MPCPKSKRVCTAAITREASPIPGDAVKFVGVPHVDTAVDAVSHHSPWTTPGFNDRVKGVSTPVG